MPVPPSPYLIDTPFISIRWYGFLIGLGMLAAVFVGLRLIKKRGLNDELMLDAVLWAIPSGILGARLYYVVFHWYYYKLHPAEIMQIWKGGLAIHGALFAGILAGLICFRRVKTDIWSYLDIAAAVLPLAQGIGRWGNWFNLEAFGTVTDLPWGMLIDGQKVHPTFLYESIIDLALFFFLAAALYRGNKKDGWAFSLYLIVYSVGRFFIEGIRTDSEWFGPFRAAQVFSLALIAVGGVIYYYKVFKTSNSQEIK